MYSTKIDIDTYFFDNWIKTQIQYDGATFPRKGQPHPIEWISVQVIPYDRDIIGIGGANGGRKQTRQLIKVFCHSDSVSNAYTLMTAVQEFLECKVIGNTRVDVGKGDGNGAIDLGNGDFEALAIFDSTFEDKIKSSVKSIVINNGIPVVNNGVQVIN